MIYSDTLRLSGPQWSPDDQQIVIGVLHNGTSSTPSWGEMRIINVAAGTVDAVPVGQAFIADSYRWTRTGSNKILYRYAETNSSTPVAMMYDVTNATSSQVNSTQINGCWSPRNDKILCRIGTSTDLKAFNPANGVSSTVTTATPTVCSDWKR